ncbi:zinc transporter ZIP9-like [Babylonia areolata]|uniref:zinc transporter ZIP9-like n=1 Tax=Babylonia areolata TaxID=304850 RepID=UPI003FD0764F
MDEIWTLLLLSLAMLVGCYLVGVIPLTVSLSEEKLKLVTVLGAGLLVGTALAVIIPEGVNAMYTGTGHHHHTDEVVPVNVVQKAADRGPAAAVGGGGVETKVGDDDDGVADSTAHHHHHDQHHDMTEEHSIIGITLVAGFIFMLLVDQMGGSVHSHSAAGDVELGTQGPQNRNKITATLGLVVHAAADGVAMGAAITMSETHITMIVFLAIMLHKAPAAFGLVSFLLHENFDRARIRRHLLVFSVAAPLLTVLTYFGLSQKSTESLSDMHTTGVAMLFSAGTFLYVATVHVLPEIATVQHRHTMADGTVVIRESKGFRNVELAALVAGAIVPVLLAIGHKH